MALSTRATTRRGFESRKLFATAGEGRRVVAVCKKQAIFRQGDAADSIFYIRKGRVRLSVISKTGKQATLSILNEEELFGEGALAGQSLELGPQPPLRTANFCVSTRRR